MTRRVFRGLDRPTDFFDIRGRHLFILLLGAMLSVILSIIAGRLTNLIFGVAAFLFLCLADYLAVRSLGYRIPDKELPRRIAQVSYPETIRTYSRHIRNMWKGWNLPSTLIR